MKFISLDTIASKWTLAHTVALSAWVVAAVLGLTLWLRHLGGSYPATDAKRVYAAENMTFSYPANWALKACESDEPFLALPGSIKTTFKGKQAYQLQVEAAGNMLCTPGRPAHFVLSATTDAGSNIPGCAQPSDRLQNGVYLRAQEHQDFVTAIELRLAPCAPPILTFSFVDPEPGDETAQPSIKKSELLPSQQYQDIRAVAESIRY